MRLQTTTAVLLMQACFTWAIAGAAELGAPVTVAPNVEGTIIQDVPRAAWSEKANCWLVAWREGDITQEKSEIWCARVSPDGKALDPQGICVSRAKDLRDRPSVASDGNDFLVAWGDFRNGKDWDVYAARVSGGGKVLDPDGFLVAGGEHNQCRPVATFCRGNYAVIFEGFLAGKGPAGAPGTGYVIYSLRVSPDGKPLDQPAVPVSDPAVRVQVWEPCAAGGGEGVLVGAYVRGFSAAYHVGFGAGLVAMPDGKAAVPIALVKAAGDNYTALSMPNRGPLPFPAAVWTGKQYLLAIATRGSEAGPGKAFAGKDSVAVIGMDGKGKEIPGDPVFVVFNGERLNSAPSVSMASDAERCLLVEDVVLSKGRGRSADEELSYQVHGCFLSPDGKPLGDGKTFAIADAAKACASGGFASAGPKGQFLVVWSEARGVDDVKVLARIVKTK